MFFFCFMLEILFIEFIPLYFSTSKNIFWHKERRGATKKHTERPLSRVEGILLVYLLKTMFWLLFFGLDAPKYMPLK